VGAGLAAPVGGAAPSGARGEAGGVQSLVPVACVVAGKGSVVGEGSGGAGGGQPGGKGAEGRPQRCRKQLRSQGASDG